jgi:hypothetical protein
LFPGTLPAYRISYSSYGQGPCPFVQAVKLEPEPYGDALEFIPEYRLSSEPLEEVIAALIRKELASAL